MARQSRSRFLKLVDWDAVAGIVAAGAALVLHLLHIVEEDVLLIIIMVILALLLLRDLRREANDERAQESTEQMERTLGSIEARLETPDVVLVGPRELRRASAEFARRAQGEMTWFNVCLSMFRPQELYDVLLRPAIENPRVSRIVFVLDEEERERWEQDVLPKVSVTQGREKVAEPHWTTLEHSISFILADADDAGHTEAHVSFWGEPFMARSTGRSIPRYVLHVRPGSELVERLAELERNVRMGTG